MWHVGRFNHQLDSKNRMRLPATQRNEYGEEFYISADIRGSLLVRQKEDMDKMSEKLAVPSVADYDVQNAVMWFYERTYLVKQDEQGRFVLPKELKDYAKIDKNVIIIGVPRGWSIWSEEVYNNRDNLAEEYKEFEKVAQILKEYGV